MPKLPGNSSLPGGFGAANSAAHSPINYMGQGNNAFSSPQFQQTRDKINSIMPQAQSGAQSFMGKQMPPNIQSMIQAIMGGGGMSHSGMPVMGMDGIGTKFNGAIPQTPTVMNMPGATQSSQSGVDPPWNPNGGIPSPSISNTPQTTSPTTPFAMPQHPPQANNWINAKPPMGNWSSFPSPNQH